MTETTASTPSAGTAEKHQYDVVVIGAGGSGLRAAIAAHDAGAKTAIVCKSLLGKAHTVMAEGGIAAAMGNRWPEDNWEVHFRDTMRGGKMLNNWRMAQLHAQEAPERVQELEDWGALFDRTEDGLISQRDFGGHRYARLAHVGDRTGLEMIRTLQQRAVALGIDVLHGVHGHRAVQGRATARSPVRSATGARPASFIAFEAPSVILATGGIGKSFKVTSNSWEYTGDGHALALRAGAVADQHGVRPVPPDGDGLAALGEGAAGHGVGPRRRRHPEELRGQAVHVRLHPGVLQGGDGRQRRRGRPLVRRQEEQPPATRAAAA